jgi:hypothetical protein
MSEKADILSAEGMRQWYGRFYDRSPKARLNRVNVPERLWPLLPYAEFWGIADDWTRDDLIEEAPPEVQHNLKAVIAEYNSALEEWLAGPEASNRNPSDEYVAFAAMIMAADSV